MESFSAYRLPKPLHEGSVVAIGGAESGITPPESQSEVMAPAEFGASSVMTVGSGFTRAVEIGLSTRGALKTGSS